LRLGRNSTGSSITFVEDERSQAVARSASPAVEDERGQAVARFSREV